MADAEFNPYAAPGSFEPGGAQNGLWQVSGSLLLFRDGAQLPEVDLFTGRTDLPLTPASSEFTVAKGPLSVWLQLIWVVGVVAMILGDKVWSYSWPMGFVVLVVVSRLLGIFMKGSMSTGRLHWRVSTQVDGKNRWRTRIRIGLGLMGIGIFVVSAKLGSLETVLWGFGLMSLCLIAAAVMGFWSRRLECSGERDGWFSLKGIPKAGLAALAERQFEANRELLEAEPRRRFRKVFAFYGYKAPLRDLLGMSWKNPLVVLIIAFMKLTKSKRLVRDHFHWSESAELDEKSWDSELVKLRDEWLELKESSNWRFLSAGWIGAPTGDALSQSFVFVSPDGRHAMVGAVVRLATAHAGGVIGEVTFRSWRLNRTLRLTSNQRVQRPLPEGFDFTVKKGSVADIFAAHQAAIIGDEIVAFGFPDEWETRISEEAEQRRSVLEAAGIYGPVREEEFPD